MTNLEMMHILQAQVCGCISAHPRLPHKKKRNRKVVIEMSVKLSKLKWESFESWDRKRHPPLSFKPFFYFSHDRTTWKGRTTICIDRVRAAHLAQPVKTHVI